jgi:uncharacterized membrane protein (UPF0127 family)
MSTGLAIGKGYHLNKGIAFGLTILLAMIILVTLKSNAISPVLNMNLLFKKAIYIDGLAFNVWIADTEEERVTSLTNLKSMPSNGGIIFLFDSDALYGVSTAKMNFPIDIIWISKDGNVVSVLTDVQPEQEYPARPTYPARYVLLVNSGTAESIGIGAETTVDISSIR